MRDRREQHKKYHKSHREEILKKKRENYAKNRESRIKDALNRHERNRKTWEGHIPIMTNCQMCGKDIFFHQKKQNSAIHFDHRYGGVEEIKRPMLWLAGHRMAPENKAKWDKCDFGMLCMRCNVSIPTKNRKQFVVNIMKYVLRLKNTDELILSCRIKPEINHRPTLNRVNSGNSRTDNPEPSSLESEKVQRLAEDGTPPLMTAKSALHDENRDDIVRYSEESETQPAMVITQHPKEGR